MGFSCEHFSQPLILAGLGRELLTQINSILETLATHEF